MSFDVLVLIYYLAKMARESSRNMRSVRRGALRGAAITFWQFKRPESPLTPGTNVPPPSTNAPPPTHPPNIQNIKDKVVYMSKSF